jgi:vancomycin resistance protein YoaR
MPSAIALAAPPSITYTYNHHIITVSVLQHPEWHTPHRIWYFEGKEAVPPARFLTCGNDEIREPGWSFGEAGSWDPDAIARTLQDELAEKLDRAPGTVTINRTGTGAVTFEGQGLPGRGVDIRATTALTIAALDENIAFVSLPVSELQPSITVNDPELEKAGIHEVVMVGESVFSKSPVNRRHNINVGVKKFNGMIIPQGEVFSFIQSLGPVNEKTGYRKELVIQGETTLPDYGGGLCQVSSTAYRGPWEYGLPIVQRRNHSYAVSYYSPQGTDATIYPPSTDMKFKNDTPGALLLQTFTDGSDRAYFIYYGTRDDRQSEVIGPFISDRVSAPKQEKIIYTTDLAPGEKKKAGEAHDGMKAVWYRIVQRAGTGAVIERYFSAYEARPLTYQIGVTVEEKARLTKGDTSETPSWLPSKD